MILESTKKEIISILPTKANIDLLSKSIIQDVEDGWQNPLDLLVRIKALESLCEQVRSGVETMALAEMGMHGRRADVLGAKVEQCEVGVKYDFSNCPKWNALSGKEKSLVEERKDRESFLKALSKPIVETDMESGETIEVYPASKTSKTSLKITLGK